jgi:peptide/nickel transport system permease protein
MSPPGTPGFFLGTDSLGRDILSRVIYGARISMIVGVVATTISVLESSIIGIISGYLGGKTDIVVQRFVDAWMCFPWLIIMLTIMSLVGAGMWQLTFVLGVTGGIGGSRVIRSAVISIRDNDYVQAGKAIGCSTPWIFVKHLLPNIFAPIIIMYSIGLGGVILAEASLSFLGYGVPPPAPSWGGMLSLEGRTYMQRAPWMALFPGLALTLVVWGTNMLGDALRDILDPRLKGGLGRYSGRKRRFKRLAKANG